MPEDLPALEPDRPDSSVEQRVDDLIAHTIDAPVLAEMVERQAPPDAANTLERLDEDDAVGVLAVMNDQAAADALVEMEPHLAAIILEDLVDESRAGELANMISLLAPDDAVGRLRHLDPGKREPIFSALGHESSI